MRTKTFRLRKIVNDIPINFKFILIYLLGVLLPIAVIHLIFMDRMSELIKQREEQNLEVSLERARKDIHDFVDGGVAVSHALKTDKALYEMLDRTYANPLDFYETFDEQLRNRVSSYIPVNNQILRIGIYTDNPTIVSGGNYQIINGQVKNSEWYKLWEHSNEPVLVAAYRAADETNPSVIAPYLSVIEKMDYYNYYDRFEKLLRIDIDLRKIYDVIIRERDYLNLYLVNEKNEIIMSADSGYQNQVSGAYAVFNLSGIEKNKDAHVVSIGTAKYVKGWKLVGMTRGTRVSQAMRDMQWSVGLLAAVVTLFTSVFIYIMLRSYNYRVKRLSRHMHKVTNEKFELIRMDEGKDEIGELIRNFNMMTSRINSLINNVYKLEIQKKSLEMEQVRAELNVLQSQMNPHFLFNTLNAILVVCTKYEYSEVTDIIKSLSKLLRRLLGWKEDLVTLEEEIRFTEMYLKIEKFRFRDKFEYVFDVDEQVLGYKIPKMSIQPLVENACKHGIQAVDGQGLVTVSARIEDERLRVSVSDNGKGITAEKRNEIMKAVQIENVSGNSIGIRNVYRRLELYYNDLVRFDIQSKWQEGTLVLFEIPMKLLNRQNEHAEGE
ncbi:sensor histidine kinase [Paenibacillus sp. VCA1]|uniref:sensor histidine kinase n=1 Tax=Paenibacillus sp. VCA1 TaxID=3039148 RepID=UPI0028729304|nr:sensor histidine kinase [Paenibacillus sp. VCA1]MDR9856347.1 sensor histidine kinase [Paenibacillus sp. VCA1]